MAPKLRFVAAALASVLMLGIMILVFAGMGGTYELHSGLSQRTVVTCFEEPMPARDFTLVDQYGREVSLSDLWDRLVVLTFTYTWCPDVCPLVHVVLNKTLSRPDVAELYADGKLVVVDVSVDPERDTVERVRRYAEANGYRWMFLTGDRKSLEGVWAAYDVVVNREVRDGNVYIAHSVAFILIRNGEILCRVDGIPTPSRLTELILGLVK